ncbi:short chain dehydrogenase [Macrophomina phaseolina]|uniref:Short chain dehydrogenase n=1 Tax=Macrophomina phaseolina TaxID=35725 RepID=A0ABQ8FX22_9PEZI|nr:short chain dehydrogenase [Macrophomina phaseolina]
MSTSQNQALTLAEKVAIVTGGSRGIGAAIAIELAKRGAKVAITFVSPSSEKLADEVISKIKSLNNGASAIKIKADMHELGSPEKIITETTAAFGNSIDILVNNAGAAYIAPLAQVTAEGFTNVMNINVRSVVLTTQAALPHLRSPGRIINIGSAMGRLGQPGVSIYSATKAALEALTRGWAAELGPAGHTVNVVAPALTATETNRSAGVTESDLAAGMRQMTPMEHRLGEPEDIALAVAMIAEPSSRWITGQTIQAGGGILMT